MLHASLVPAKGTQRKTTSADLCVGELAVSTTKDYLFYIGIGLGVRLRIDANTHEAVVFGGSDSHGTDVRVLSPGEGIMLRVAA